ncbi:hypothetical protein [Neisseria perflava]|uniref:hypothetical protein n=1 Tax=Neisseria perflava TaxID=33053 RepID=UPI00209F47E4|nr:hypothetical protein [Neisseria perflava]MCP1659317.1 hypothetical protein [Neisseria perflava]
MKPDQPSPEEQQSLPAGEQQRMMQEFIELQKQEVAVRHREQENRKDEIQSNERIALATIEAQKSSDLKHGEVFTQVHSKLLTTITAIAFFVAAVLVVALCLNKDNVAIELIKIGGAVLLGYFAGINKGKAEALERQRREKED